MLFSKKEREFINNPFEFNPEYSRVLVCRIKRKIRNTIIDLQYFADYKTDIFKFDENIEISLNGIVF